MVNDRSSADWVVQKIKAERQKQADLKAWAAHEIEKSKHREESLVQRFGLELHQFAQANQERGRKSLALPSGTVGTRLQKTKLVVTDESVCMDWCRENLPLAMTGTFTLPNWEYINQLIIGMSGKFTKLALALNKTVLNDHFESTGEVPPGTDVVAGHDKFFIDTPVSKPEFVEAPELTEPEEEEQNNYDN